MKLTFRIFTLVYFLSFAVYSQTPQPTSTPIEDDDIVKITTSLIRIDSMVTDYKGRVVSDLKRGEFEIYENGKKQKITTFSFVSAKNKQLIKPKNAKIRDYATGKVGSANQFIQVPKLKKKRLTLSGFGIENIPYKQWIQRQTTGAKIVGSDPFLDTSLRKFKRGTILTYGFEIYNSKFNRAKKTQLQMRPRVFYNGKLLFEGTDKPITQKINLDSISASGALSLGTEMKLGDYVLQIVVTDKLAKRKRQIATQFVQFEIVE